MDNLVNSIKKILGINSKPKSAKILKDRLTLVLAQDKDNPIDNIEMFEQEIIEVVEKYIPGSSINISNDLDEETGLQLVSISVKEQD
ncbi:hypothetical protein HOK00_11345 [bacterium]|jgi:cell division topological specificity factor MinE|nr:hypothetical protein [bacterium]